MDTGKTSPADLANTGFATFLQENTLPNGTTYLNFLNELKDGISKVPKHQRRLQVQFIKDAIDGLWNEFLNLTPAQRASFFPSARLPLRPFFPPRDCLLGFPYIESHTNNNVKQRFTRRQDDDITLQNLLESLHHQPLTNLDDPINFFGIPDTTPIYDFTTFTNNDNVQPTFDNQLYGTISYITFKYWTWLWGLGFTYAYLHTARGVKDKGKCSIRLVYTLLLRNFVEFRHSAYARLPWQLDASEFSRLAFAEGRAPTGFTWRLQDKVIGFNVSVWLYSYYKNGWLRVETCELGDGYVIYFDGHAGVIAILGFLFFVSFLFCFCFLCSFAWFLGGDRLVRGIGDVIRKS